MRNPYRTQLATLFIICLFLLNHGTSKGQETTYPQLIIQNGHTASVTSLAYSPDSTMIASGSEDYTIKLWNIRTGYLTTTLAGHSGSILSLAFSPDGSILISGSQDGTVRVWDISSGEFLRVFKGHTSRVNCIAFSPTGQVVASASGWYGESTANSVQLWNPNTGALIRELKRPQTRASSVAFSSDGTTLATADESGSIELWDVDSGRSLAAFSNVNQVVVNGTTRLVPVRVNGLQFSPDGTTLATVGDYTIRFWNIRTARVIRQLNVESFFSQPSFSPDWTTIATPGSYDGNLRLLASDNGQPTKILAGSDRLITALSFSPNGNFLAAGSSDHRIKVWDLQTSKLLRKFENNSGNVTSMSRNRAGNIIAWSRGHRVELWDARKGEMLRILEADSFVNSLAFNPNKNILAAGTSEGGIKLWSIPDGRPLRSPLSTGQAQAVTFSSNGQVLAYGGADENLNLIVNRWDLKNNRLRPKLTIVSPYRRNAAVNRASQRVLSAHAPTPGPDLAVFSIAFSKDDKRIAAGTSFQTVSVFNAVNSQVLYTLKGHNFSVTSVAFSPDGKMLLSAGTNIKLWSVGTGNLLNTFEPHTDYINQAAFSPNGKSILSASNDRTIKVLSVTNGEILASFEDHASGVNCISFSPDGQFIASGSIDATSRIWSLKTKQLLSTVIALNDNNWITYTPDGYYNASPGATKYISWRDHDEIYSDIRYKSQFFNPNEVVNRSLGLSIPPRQPARTVSIPVRKTEAVVLSTAEDTLIRDWGPIQYYALVIGEAAYPQSFPSVTTPAKNAASVARVLQNEFNFQVERLPNATRKQILDALDRYRHRADIDNNANLLIYYSGHGAYEDDTEVAYWQPVDADPQSPSTWVSSDDVINRIRGINARHVLIVSDSCFSGGFFESTLSQIPIMSLDQSMRRPSREIMTAGEKEYVDALGPDGYSTFTFSFLQALHDVPNNVFTAEQLFYEYVKKYVQRNDKNRTSQTPQFGPIPTAGRSKGNLGHFVFIRRK
jgi:WD40 repeat protein